MPARVKVYSLLTLDEATIKSILPGCDVAPPIKRGDVLEDLAAGYHCIVIIDGRFHHDLSVSCDELMDAIRGGVVVFGASSMGAMRAAELHVYGMRGAGRIFEHIKDSDEFRDDLLGQTFEQSANQVTALTTPFIDLHFSLLRLKDQGAISAASCEAIRELALALHYTERSPALLREALAGEGHGAEVVAALDAALALPSQKRADALAVLAAARDHLAHVARVNDRLSAALSPLSPARKP